MAKAKKTAAKRKPAKTKTTTKRKPVRKKATGKRSGAKKPAAKRAARGQKVDRGGAATGTDAAFYGFPAEGLRFLAELALNNEREWFAANKERYERFVLEPSLAFIRAMKPRLRKLSKNFTAVDKRVGGSVMRIYRDTRFSPDKTPYKTNVGIQFRHVAGKDVHAPGLYLHIEPDQAFLGVGMWHPEREALEGVRAAILDKPVAWKRVREDQEFRKHWRLEGESLKRPPRGVDPEHPLIDDLRRKDHIAVGDVKLSAVTNKNLPDVVAARLQTASRYLKFLCDATGVPY